jgi:hypothetical protein
MGQGGLAPSTVEEANAIVLVAQVSDRSLHLWPFDAKVESGLSASFCHELMQSAHEPDGARFFQICRRGIL